MEDTEPVLGVAPGTRAGRIGIRLVGVIFFLLPWPSLFLGGAYWPFFLIALICWPFGFWMTKSIAPVFDSEVLIRRCRLEYRYRDETLFSAPWDRIRTVDFLAGFDFKRRLALRDAAGSTVGEIYFDDLLKEREIVGLIATFLPREANLRREVVGRPHSRRVYAIQACVGILSGLIVLRAVWYVLENPGARFAPSDGILPLGEIFGIAALAVGFLGLITALSWKQSDFGRRFVPVDRAPETLLTHLRLLEAGIVSDQRREFIYPSHHRKFNFRCTQMLSSTFLAILGSLLAACSADAVDLFLILGLPFLGLFGWFVVVALKQLRGLLPGLQDTIAVQGSTIEIRRGDRRWTAAIRIAAFGNYPFRTSTGLNSMRCELDTSEGAFWYDPLAMVEQKLQ